jgi:hypothetical protein
MRQNQMTFLALAMGDWFMLLAGCFAAIALTDMPSAAEQSKN